MEGACQILRLGWLQVKGTGSDRRGQNPAFTPQEKEGLRDYWHVYDKHYDRLLKALMAMVLQHDELGSLIRAVPPQALDEQYRANRERQRKAFMEGDWESYWNTQREDGARYAQAGLSFTAWFELTTALKAEVIALLVDEFKGDPARLQASLHSMDKLYDAALGMIGEQYLSTKEATIAKQAEAIRELSTPVLQIRNGRLIVPLIGLIDTRRAREITEHLLEAIRDHRAKVVIIDITAVAAVDSKVANHLIQTVEAARLMGATTIVTGLSAEVAQTLVTLGVDLSRVRTVSDLQSGVEEADRIQGVEYARDK
jgi:rsbT co-antagonist protein RsbR